MTYDVKFKMAATKTCKVPLAFYMCYIYYLCYDNEYNRHKLTFNIYEKYSSNLHFKFDQIEYSIKITYIIFDVMNIPSYDFT